MSEHLGAAVRALSVIVLLASSACSLPSPGSRAAAKDHPGRPAAPQQQAVPRAAGPSCPKVQPTRIEGRVANDEVDELSGAIASQQNAGVFWVHNDSGDDARAFAIDLQGRALAELELTHVDALDIEDIALVRGQASAPDQLYLADIGDNWKRRRKVQLFRVQEPRLAGQREGIVIKSAASVIDVVYDDGPHDAETLLADPRSGDLFIVAKSHNLLSEEPVGVYRLPAAELKKGSVLARKVATLALGPTTAGDIAPDGSAIIVRNYWSAMYWPRALGETVAEALAKAGCRLPVSDLGKQGESLTFTRDGRAYVTIPEGLHPVIMRYVLE